ncbi:MAG: ferrous iron transport protein A [Puniceicoccaceae bacterium]
MGQVVQLREMEPGQTGTVSQFSGEDGQRLRLMEMGLLPGTEVRFVRRAPLGGPLELEVRGFHLSLRQSEADCIEVKLD